MGFALGPFALYRDGGFIGLNVGAGEKVCPEEGPHAQKQFAHREHRTSRKVCALAFRAGSDAGASWVLRCLRSVLRQRPSASINSARDKEQEWKREMCLRIPNGVRKRLVGE